MKIRKAYSHFTNMIDTNSNHKKTLRKKGFTIIEMLLAIAITSIFISVFVQIALPVRDTLAKNYSEMESYRQLLFLNMFLDDFVRSGGVVISTSSILSSSSGTINFTNTAEIIYVKYPIIVPLISLTRYGTSTFSIEKDINNDQYRMYIGKYILQFGIFPHVYVNKNANK